jgi:hypothetical protein
LRGKKKAPLVSTYFHISMFSYLWYFTVIIKRGISRTRVIGYYRQEENLGMTINHRPQIKLISGLENFK